MNTLSTSSTEKQQTGNHTRASRACLTCSRSRVKCEGAVPGSTTCARCARRGDVCEFSEPKKRGPKGPRGSTTLTTNASEAVPLFVGASTAEMATGSDSDGQASSGKVSTSTGDGGGNRRSRDLSDEDVEKGVIPAAKRMNLNADTLSQDDYFLIAAYFRHCNVMIPCVDEVEFRSMLNALEEQQQKILTESSSTFDSTVESNSKGLYAAVSDSKFASFRVLLHTVLCCAALIEGQPAIARHHYGVSCALIPLCLNLNSKHLVSALLVFSLISRSIGKNNVTESLQHVRLARQSSDRCF